MKLNNKQESLYWRGHYFPGTLSKAELKEWLRLQPEKSCKATNNEIARVVFLTIVLWSIYFLTFS
ncbi:MAG: hypothetical protein EBU90_22880 [Proteobacteria bacterium]|nr:hypothetical protein [Pseudomonadota bacterium]